MINETLATNTTWDTLTTVYDAFNILPFFIAIIVIGILFGYIGIPSSSDDIEETPEERYESTKRKRKPNPEQILKERLANGNITPEDYTDRMSRL